MSEEQTPQTEPLEDPEAATPAPGPDAEADPSGGPAPEVEVEVEPEPETELELALRERGEYLDLAQRARAELENYRKRVAGDARNAEQRGKAAVARGLIPAIDNLERALLAAGVDPSGAIPDSEPASQEVSARTALAEGVALVYRELTEGLERAGVGAFDPTGERFDPALHEAVTTAEVEGTERGVVIETLEKGYRIGEQILRPARVVVSG